MSTKFIRVLVPGVAVPQGSVRAIPTNRGTRIVHDKGRDLVAWRNKITVALLRECLLNGWGHPLDEPVEVNVFFKLPRPKTVRRSLPWAKPDLDKLMRAVGDALCPRDGHRVLVDDSRIIAWTAWKDYVEEGVLPYVLIELRRVL